MDTYSPTLTSEAAKILAFLEIEPCDKEQCRVVEPIWFMPDAKPGEKAFIPLNYNSIPYLECVGFTEDTAEQIYSYWKKELIKMEPEEVVHWHLIVAIRDWVVSRLQEIPAPDSRETWYDILRHIGFTEEAIGRASEDDDDGYTILEQYPNVYDWVDDHLYRLFQHFEEISKHIEDRWSDCF